MHKSEQDTLREILKRTRFVQRLPNLLRITGSDALVLKMWGATLLNLSEGVLKPVNHNENKFLRSISQQQPAGISARVWIEYCKRRELLMQVRSWVSRSEITRDSIRQHSIDMANKFRVEPGLVDMAIVEICAVDGKDLPKEASYLSETNPVSKKPIRVKGVGEEGVVTWADYVGNPHAPYDG